MIFVAGISIAFFISALILVKKEKSKSDIILLLWMILNALHLSFFYLFHTEAIYDYPHLLGIGFPFPLLHGVLLYYYVATVTNQQPKRKLTVWIHLAPTIIAYLYIGPFFFESAEQKIKEFKSGGESYLVFQEILIYAVFLSGIIYVIWSSLLLRNHKARIRDEFSNLEEVNLNWLRLLTYGLGIVWSVVIFTQNDALIYLGVSVFVILVGFFGIQQKNIFNSPASQPIVDDIAEQSDPKEKYVNSGLSNEKEELFYDKLNKLVIDDKVYTNSDLSLSDLAAKLDINPNYLSQIINKKENKTFYDYINAFRVEEFKRLIAIPKNQQFTLMAVAYDCGFNSKSSFNRYFKKITGLTPSQFAQPLKSQKNN